MRIETRRRGCVRGCEKASERPWNQRVPRPLFILEKIKFGDGMEMDGIERGAFFELSSTA
jgi:hypothetical protein